MKGIAEVSRSPRYPRLLKRVLGLAAWCACKVGIPVDVFCDSRFWLSQARMKRFRNRHERQRCFIIGNGPSLATMDLSPLKNEITFGTNRIYLLFPRMGFSTTYYVSVNRYVIEQCARDIEALPMPKFISWHTRDIIRFTENMMFVRDPYTSPLGFSKRPHRKIWEGSTVTYAAMQLAFFMGFRQVVLIGVDHSFATKGNPHALVVSDGGDRDHFDPRYFGAGFRWQLPDLDGSEQAYQLAKHVFEQEGREILDATSGGKLEVFRKIDYLSLFQLQPSADSRRL